MAESSSSVYVTAPDTFETDLTRTNTSFGLRELEHAHDEEVVPGIGSLQLVRQASWAVAAIKLFSEDSEIRRHVKTPAILANAIEALGCKLEFFYGNKDNVKRGVRAFGRPGAKDIWKFKDLCKTYNYVQNTYRQSVVDALSGLGFCDESTSLFNKMVLTPKGEELAKHFLEIPENNVTQILKNWICEKSSNISSKWYVDLFSPAKSNSAEKEYVKLCLNSHVPLNQCSDSKKRIRLIKLMERPHVEGEHLCVTLCGNLRGDGEEGKIHARQIENAVNFESIKNCVRKLYNSCVNYMANNSLQRCSFKTLYQGDVEDNFTHLKKAIEKYRKGGDKCPLPKATGNELISSAYDKFSATMRYLVKHEGRALILENDNGVVRGSLFKENGFSPTTDECPNWGHPRLERLANLLGECDAK